MQVNWIFDYIPIWGVFLVTVLLSYLSFEFGFWLIQYKKQTVEQGPEASVGSIISAILSLLAFILAFTFSFAASRFDERNKLVLDEAVAIEQVYLRASFLPESYRLHARTLIRDYALVRLEGVRALNKQADLIESLRIQQQLWKVAEEVEVKAPSTAISMKILFIQSLSDVIATHVRRVMIGIHRHIPNTIWSVLYFITIIAFISIGYYIGMKSHRYLTMNLALIVTFSAVITLIADLDRPQNGTIKVSQRPIIDVYNKINSNIFN